MASVAQSNPHHRKIELQSPLDLTHLQTQLSTSARQKLDLHFPPSALQPKPATHITLGGGPSPPQPQPANPTDEQEETDPLRAHVQRLLTAFLHRTWTSAAPSISINGLDAPINPDPHVPPPPTTQQHPHPQQQPQPEREGVDFTYAPYDARLQGRLAELYGELEGLTAQVARLRREAPARGAAAWEGALGAAIQREDQIHDEDDDEGAGGKGQVKGKGKERRQQQQQLQHALEMRAREALREGWAEDVKGAYEEAVAELARLSGYKIEQLGDDGGSGGGDGTGGRGGLTGTVGKVQRARDVAEELE